MDILTVTKNTLEDLLLMLSKLDDSLYTQSIPLLFNGTVGKQVRHLIEFYQCLLNRKNSEVVNYDERVRDIVLETKMEVAKESIHHLVTNLDGIKCQEKLLLKTMLLSKKEVPTNLTRELLYLHDHCVHHLALIRVGLHFIQPDIVLPTHLGVAMTTLENQES